MNRFDMSNPSDRLVYVGKTDPLPGADNRAVSLVALECPPGSDIVVYTVGETTASADHAAATLPLAEIIAGARRLASGARADGRSYTLALPSMLERLADVTAYAVAHALAVAEWARPYPARPPCTDPQHKEEHP